MPGRLDWCRKQYGEKLLQDIATGLGTKGRDILIDENLAVPKGIRLGVESSQG